MELIYPKMQFQLLESIFKKKLVVNIPPNHPLDRRFIAGLAIVIAAIDGRGKK